MDVLSVLGYRHSIGGKSVNATQSHTHSNRTNNIRTLHFVCAPVRLQLLYVPNGTERNGVCDDCGNVSGEVAASETIGKMGNLENGEPVAVDDAVGKCVNIVPKRKIGVCLLFRSGRPNVRDVRSVRSA